MSHVRAMLLDSTAYFQRNSGRPKLAMWIRSYTTRHHLGGRAPCEAFYGVKPDVANILLWRSRVWARDLTAGKLDTWG